jgi:CelD/BcsL family acetyltransferase involved in cellulose biosynthesis
VTAQIKSTVDEWSAHTTRDGEALRELAGEWDDLYARSSRATPFQTHAWIWSWWAAYGRPGALVLLQVRHRGRLVAAGAWHRRRRGPVPVLLPLGHPISDFTDVLLDDEYAGTAAGLLAAELARCRGRRVVDLPDVPASANLWSVIAAWPGRHWRYDGAPCLELPARRMPDLVASLPAKTARRARAKQRAIVAAGVAVRWTCADEAAATVAAMMELHKVQWRDRGMTTEHARPRFTQHLAAAAPAMVGRGQAALVEYRVDDRLLAVDLLLVGHGMVGAYLYGIHPDLRRRVDAALLLLTQNLELACRLGRPTSSFLRGDEQYKRVWRPDERRNQRILLGGAWLDWGRPYAVAVRMRRRAADVARRWLPVARRLIARGRAWRPFST